MKQIKHAETFQIIDALVQFSEQAGIKPSANMELVANTMKNINGNVYLEVFEKAKNKFLTGFIDIKTPYIINNKFLSELLNKYFDSNRTQHGQYKEEETIRPSDEEINRIFEEGIKVSRERVKKYMAGQDTFISPFLLYNEYEWLVQNKGLDPNDLKDEEVNRLTGDFMRHDSMIKGKFEAPEMKEADYMKAACVALFLII